MPNYNNERKLVGSMWKKTSKAGNNFFSILLNDPENSERQIDLVVFKAKEKKTEKSPDFLIFHSDKNNTDQKKGTSKEIQDDDGFDL